MREVSVLAGFPRKQDLIMSVPVDFRAGVSGKELEEHCTARWVTTTHQESDQLN